MNWHSGYLLFLEIVGFLLSKDRKVLDENTCTHVWHSDLKVKGTGTVVVFLYCAWLLHLRFSSVCPYVALSINITALLYNFWFKVKHHSCIALHTSSNVRGVARIKKYPQRDTTYTSCVFLLIMKGAILNWIKLWLTELHPSTTIIGQRHILYTGSCCCCVCILSIFWKRRLCV